MQSFAGVIARISPLVMWIVPLFCMSAFAQTPASTKPHEPVRVTEPDSSIDIDGFFQVAQFRLAEKAGAIVAHLGFSNDDHLDDLVTAIDLKTGLMQPPYQKLQQAVTVWRDMEISPDGLSIAFIIMDGRLVSYDLKTQKEVWSWKPQDGDAIDPVIRFTADKRYAAGTIGNSTAILWDMATGKAKSVKLDFLNEGEGAALVPRDDSRVLLMTRNKDAADPAAKYNLDLFDLKTRQREHLSKVSSGLSVIMLPNGSESLILRGKEVMRTISEEGASRLRVQELYWSAVERWDLGKKQMISASSLDPPLLANQFRMSADGRVLVIHEPRHRAAVYDIVKGRVAALVGPEAGLSSVDISRDGKLLAATFRETNAEGKFHTKFVTYSLEKLVSAPEAK